VLADAGAFTALLASRRNDGRGFRGWWEGWGRTVGR